jgi:hypothetical protein
VQEFLKGKINRKLNNALNSVLQDLLKPDAPKRRAPTPEPVPAAGNDNQQQPDSDDATGGWADPAKQSTDKAAQPTQPEAQPAERLDPAQLLLRQILGQ